MMTSEISKVLKSIVEAMLEGKYKDIIKQDRNRRLSEEELRKAVIDYPGNLTMPPNSAFSAFHVYGNQEGPQFFVEFELWFDGKESDLTLSVTLFREGGYAIDDLHVL